MGKPHIPLPEIRAAVEACHRCPLSQGRTQTVFGVGNPRARVLFVGEAPGRNEDLQGEPFVGAAGHMLNDLLAIAGLSRDDVYIANVLKCRPPGNRDPRPEEIELCAPFLREQTRTIMPDFIVTLGKFATQFILKTEVGITRLPWNLAARGSLQRLPDLPSRGRALRWQQARGVGERFCDARRAFATGGHRCRCPRWFAARWGRQGAASALGRSCFP